MLNLSRFKTFARICLAGVCLPVCLAGTCPQTTTPPPPGTVTLRSETLTGAAASAPALTGQCGTGGVNTTNISNATAGKTLHASVTCTTAQSRPQIFITDGTTIIAASAAVGIAGPSASVDGLPPASNNFQVRVRECDPSAAGRLYTITVTQDQ